jgi:hypothetical protein
MWGSHGGEDADISVLGSNAVDTNVSEGDTASIIKAQRYCSSIGLSL